MRYLFFIIVVIVGLFFVLEADLREQNSELPVFLRDDAVAQNHVTDIDVQFHSLYRPGKYQLRKLISDYSGIWAHLNHLYACNDIEAGKEYYTEDWFKQLASHYEGVQKESLQRSDEKHQLHIMNWASDGLVCAAIDSNVVIKYVAPDKTTWKTASNLAIVIVFQGDHWRIDAMKVLDEHILAN